jgi:single-strand DNA-binding protein
MASLNRVLLAGNLTRDPEIRRLPSGMAVGDLRLAVSEKYKNRSGAEVETACFVDVVVWDKTAENCEQYLHKGSPILVEGKLQMDEWQGKDGQKRSKLRVRADRLQFLGSRSAPAGGGNAGPEADMPTPDESMLPAAEGGAEEQPF